ncbi:MAG: sulfatase-like hydrolase/transferase, partial [Actinomycetota bacterium]|nr:sulfatase-like hydrolase/transferase [Actinomycetota bacterium]
RYDRFINSIKPGRRPGFWMKHVLLPHGPYMFLPSGAQTRQGARDQVPGMNSPQGFGDAFLTRHNEQRYLLQLGFADHEIGRLLNRLVKLGMYDDTMIVLVADHGMDFGIGVKDRRKVNSRNVQEIGPVPLFVKAAGQRRGRADGAYASTLDVTPTIADVLNFKLPYRADGRSAFSRAVKRRRTVSLPTRDFSRIVRISARAYERRRRAVVRRRLRYYGSGLTGLYSGIGPNRDLVGRPLSALRTAGPGAVRGSLVGARAYANVRRRSLVVPAQVAGSLKGGKRGARRDLAVVVNGRVEAVARSFRLRGDPREHFAAMVPEDTLREGRNGVEVYEVSGGRLLRLVARA